MINISIGTAGLTALLGYSVVFLGIVFLMAVITIAGKCMKNQAKPQPTQSVNLGNVSAPKGSNYKQIAAIAAAIAEMEREAK